MCIGIRFVHRIRFMVKSTLLYSSFVVLNIKFCRHRLTVRTQGSQLWNRSSILRGGTIDTQSLDCGTMVLPESEMSFSDKFELLLHELCEWLSNNPRSDSPWRYQDKDNAKYCLCLGIVRVTNHHLMMCSHRSISTKC